MNKKILSTFEREMQDPAFRESFERGYKDFSISETLMGLMEENHKTVRGLAHEVGLSPSLIQKVRSGKQQDLKISNFLSIAEACGYHLCLKKGKQWIEL
jgi:DNA-binding Xre family transcriptional regulator